MNIQDVLCEASTTLLWRLAQESSPYEVGTRGCSWPWIWSITLSTTGGKHKHVTRPTCCLPVSQRAEDHGISFNLCMQNWSMTKGHTGRTNESLHFLFMQGAFDELVLQTSISWGQKLTVNDKDGRQADCNPLISMQNALGFFVWSVNRLEIMLFEIFNMIGPIARFVGLLLWSSTTLLKFLNVAFMFATMLCGSVTCRSLGYAYVNYLNANQGNIFI